MERHLIQNVTQRSKRHLNMNEQFFSPSFQRKQPRLINQKAFNQNRSLSPTHLYQRLPTKNIYSSSYTSLNSYLKEYNLSEKDFIELRKALKTIFNYLQSKIICDHKQRLTSPYLQQRLNNNHQSLLPLYTNEYFIRNGLLNHNDGPDIYDKIFQSRNLCYSYHSKSIIHLESCLSSSSSSSVNNSLPLALFPNQKYLFTALTNNFASKKSRRSQSNMELTMFKFDDDRSDTRSMMIRRNKVQTWERENILQQNVPVAYSSIQQNDETDASEYHRSSIVRTSSTSKDKKTAKIIEESIAKNSTSLRTYNKEEGNDRLLAIKDTNDLFPMVKILAPYIIIRDSFHLNSNCILSTNIDSTNNEKSVQHVNHLPTTSEKQTLTDVLHPPLVTAKHRSLWLPSASPLNPTSQSNTNEQVHQRKKNYLLAEFESVLTQISKK